MVVPEPVSSDVTESTGPATAERGTAGPSDIEVRVPASATHLPVVRALAADLAVRLDFDLDQVSDLRMAVDEACAELVALSPPETKLACVFRVTAESIQVVTSAPTRGGTGPARDTFGWQVLTALVDEADTWVSPDGVAYLQLTKYRPGAVE